MAAAPITAANASVDSDDAAWAKLSGAGAISSSGPASGPASGGGTGVPAANDDDAAWEAMGGSKYEAPPPSPPAATPPAGAHPVRDALRNFGDALDARTEAGIARIPAAVQEGYGSSKYNEARKKFWQLTLGPDVMRYAQEHQSSLRDDPLVDSTSKHLGIRSDVFTRDLLSQANMSDADRQAGLTQAKLDMATGAALKHKGAEKRQIAAQVEQGSMLNDAPIENEAISLLSIGPELAAPIVATVVGGPAGGLAVGGAVGADFAARGYSSAKDAGASDDAAQVYAVLSAGAMLVPEIPVVSAISKEGVPILTKAFAKQAGQTAVNQGVAMGVQQSLMIAVNKGVLNQDTSLPDALRQIGVAVVEGSIIGPVAHTAGATLHATIHGEPPMPAAGESTRAPAFANAPPLSPQAGADREGALGRAARTGTLLQDAENEDSLGTVVQETAPAHHRDVVEAGPANVMELGAQHAADIVREAGGDALDQTVAAAHANAALGGLHDGAAVGALQERRLAALEAQRQEAENDAALEAQNVPTNPADEAFAQREVELSRQKDEDFARAKNQVGQQEIDNAEAMRTAAEKGGATEPAPTLADILPPEQRAVLEQIKARRAAAPEPTVQGRIRAQARGTPEDFKPLAPEAMETASEPVEEEGPETPKPPPVTAQSFAERRQAALDAAMARKVGGERPPFPGEEAAPEQAKPVNRLVAIRAAAEKARARAAEKASNETEPVVSRTEVAGIPIAIQTPEGEARASGATPTGGDYGYVKGTLGADGMHIDALIGRQPSSKQAWVVDHLDKEGKWSQHKVLLGFNNQLEAMRSYRSLFPDNPLGKVSEVSTDALKSWLAKGDTTKPFARTVESVSKAEPQLSANGLVNRRPKQYVARDSATGAEKARFDRFEEARAHREAHPNQDIVIEPKLEAGKSAISDDTQFVFRNGETGEEVAKYDTYREAREHHKANPTDRIEVEPKADEKAAPEPVREETQPPAAEREEPPVQEEAVVPPMEREEPPPRRTLSLKDRRAERRFIADQKGRARFADTSQPSARPEDQLYERGLDGTHKVTTPGDGSTTAVDHPNTHDLVVRSTETGRADRAAGNGAARIERLAQVAHDRGGVLHSDSRVSEPASRVYDRLKEKGYDVRTNPHTVHPGTGERLSTSELTPVHEVGPRDLTKLNVLRIKRLAAQGDPAARAEMDRRLNADEPRTTAPEAAPEQGILARRRALARDDEAWEAARDAVPGQRRGPAITKEEATQRLQPLIDKVGADKLHVHDSLDDPELPQNIRDDAREFNHPNPRAAFDPKTGAIHVFAGAGGHADLEALHDTAVHELAHRGIRNFLGEDYSRTLQDVYDNIHNRAGALRSPIDGVRKLPARDWMADYLSQHAMDSRNADHQQIAADEYIASIAEHDANDPRQANPSLLRRVIDAVRAGLRKLKVLHEWTDNDIRRLLRNSNNNPESPHARAAREDFGNGIRWADSEDRSVERLAPDDPAAVAAKYQRVLAESARYNPGYVKSRLDALSHLKDFLPDWADHSWETAKDGGRSLWLYSIPMDKIPDHVNPDLNPSVRGYARQVRRMNGRVGQQLAAAHEVYKPWNEFAARDPGRAARLDDIMHESTLAGVDPSKPFEYRFTDEQRAKSAKKTAADAARKESHAELSKTFKSLGEEGQRIYRDVRDAYKQQRADYDAALEKRMQDLGISEEGRNQLKALMQRGTNESGRVPEPYFPLARWGDRFAVAKHAGTDEVHSYSRFETKRQQREWADAMRTEGYDVTEGRDTGSNNKASHGVNPAFLNKVLELTKDFEPKEGSEEGSSSIADEIYQHYLSSLPDRSYRKMFMHRTGRLGFAGNARRAFADQSIRHAKAVAQIEYGHQLDAMLDNVSREQKKIAKLASDNPSNRYLQREAEWAPAIRNELQQRHEGIRNPSSSKVVSALTGFGFHYYLGFNPATAARIHTQQYINALPWLGARHGWDKAGHELTTAMKQYATTRGSFGDVLRGDERRAWDEMNDNGTFMNSQAQSLTAASRGDSLQRAGTSNAAKWAARANYASTYMFNGIEHLNRETTAMAAYRLARKERQSHGVALEHAMAASDTTHFDYSPANRPRILQGQAGKIGGLFAQYSVHQAYRIMRDARDGFAGNRNISPAERHARLATLAGMLGMAALIAGPGNVAAPVFGAINLAMNANSDGPAFDSKAALHAYLVQHLGSRFLADTIMSGPISSLTGASLASTGLWDVFHREASGDTAHANWYSRIAPYVPIFGSMLQGGPLGELGQDVSTGIADIRAGNYERALEHLLPMGFRGAPKALRHALYGEVRPNALPLANGANQTMNKSEFGIRAFLSQLANFTPQSLADRREENTAKQNAVRSVTGESGTGGPRSQIMHEILQASMQKDRDRLASAIEEAKKFNAANPTMAITSEALAKSAQSAGRNASEEIHGVSLPVGMRIMLQRLYSQDLPTPARGRQDQ